jgi:hypothetical protein
MSDKQLKQKNPHELFREIDGLCEEIDKAIQKA